MKHFNRLIFGVIVLTIIIVIAVNIRLTSIFHSKSDGDYRVEINRLQQEIQKNGFTSIHLTDYPSVISITVLKNHTEEKEFLEGDGYDYIIKEIEGDYYRFDYMTKHTEEYKSLRTVVNLTLFLMSAFLLGILIYIKLQLVKPFYRIKDIPYELSKGNLSVGLKEQKSRFFGKFIWGINLLREHLEEQKSKELALQKEKKTLVLSISHDIKTPLSAIKLYSSALTRNLYDNDDKKMEIAKKIGSMADEIEGFVSQIIKASSEDFLHLEVHISEFYLRNLMEKIKSYYSEKLDLLHIDFSIEKFSDCLIKGDFNRMVEVIQNIIENSIKYGNGKLIRMEITSEEDYRLITITNSGCTLSVNEIPHMFDSFWRGSNVGNHSGSGLGLYICRQLMLKMEGDIFAERCSDEMKITVVIRRI